MKTLALVITVLLVPTAQANTDLKIMGGAGSIKKIQTKQKAVEEKIKVKVTYAEGTSENGVIAVTKGFVDIASLAEMPEVTVKRLLENKTISGVEVKDFEWVKYSEQLVHMQLNDKNPVGTLTEEQIKGIVSGTIRNWKDVGGTNLPIMPCMAKTTFVTNNAVLAHYNEGKPSSVIHQVVDQSGIVNFVKREPGAACVSSTKTPESKEILMAVKIPSHFFYKKNAPPAVKAFVEAYMKI